MEASEMGRRRWHNVSAEVRSRLASMAAHARWALATEVDLQRARARARIAREFRTRKLAARALGIAVSDLENVDVRLLKASKFRKGKSREQAAYWRALKQGTAISTVQVRPQRAKHARVVHPPAFSVGRTANEES